MKKIKKLILGWLGFSRKEINGFLILLPLMAILIFSKPLYHFWLANQEVDFTADRQKLDSLVAVISAEPEKSERDSGTVQPVIFFPFDPNTSSVSQLQELGFSKILSNRIAHYRQKGGTFRVKSDLLKIYGLDSTFYKQLYAYIRLPDQ